MHCLWLGRNLVSRLSIIFVSREVSWSTLGCTLWRAIKKPDLHRNCSERPNHGRGQRSPALTVKCGNDDSVWIKTCEDLDPARRLPCLVQRFGTQRSGDPGRLPPPAFAWFWTCSSRLFPTPSGTCSSDSSLAFHFMLYTQPPSRLVPLVAPSVFS